MREMREAVLQGRDEGSPKLGFPALTPRLGKGGSNGETMGEAYLFPAASPGITLPCATSCMAPRAYWT